MFKSMFEKAITCLIFQVSGQTSVLDPSVYWYFLVLRQPLGLLVFLNFNTILGPTSVELIFKNILYAPNVANLRFWKINPNNCIIIPRKFRSGE